MSSTNRSKSLKTLLTTVILVGSCIFILQHILNNREELDIVWQLELASLAFLLGIYVVIHLIASVKLLLILHSHGLRNIALGEWIKIFTVSRFANLLVTQGANIYRSVKLKKEHQFSYTNSLSLTTVWMWFECMWILLFLAIIVIFIDPLARIQGIPLIAIVVTLLSICGIAPFIGRNISSRWHPKSSVNEWINTHTEMFFSSVTKSISNPSLLGKLFFINVIWFGFYVFWVQTSFEALGLQKNIVYLSVFTVVLLLSRTFNIVPGNIGLQEILCGYLGQIFGMSLTEGVVVSGLVRAIEYITVMVGGILFAKTIWIKDEVKRLEKENQ